LPSRINKFGSTSSYVTAHCKNIFIEKYTSNDAYTFMISSKDITHEQLAKRLKESLFMARLAKKKEKHPL